jgi:hypothetical protein
MHSRAGEGLEVDVGFEFSQDVVIFSSCAFSLNFFLWFGIVILMNGFLFFVTVFYINIFFHT